MEFEALKRGSDGSVAGGGGDVAAALEAQTKVLQEALAGKTGMTSVTSVKTDVNWPTLTDDRSEARDVAQFYEAFEDCCSLANNCKGMSFREQLIALRSRCRGSRLKTYTNLHRAACKSGGVLENPEAVYLRIKDKHLVFAESKEEKEVRIDNEHVLLQKGRLRSHQFEPFFESSVSELEAIGLGKTPRELYLSYLRKMPPHLQKEIRSDKRLWKGGSVLRGPLTWEEAHRVVLEYEQREATHRATANAVLAAGSDMAPNPKPNPAEQPSKNPKKTKVEKPQSVLVTQPQNQELRKKALAALKEASGGKGQEQTFASKGAKGSQKGKGGEKGSGKDSAGKGSKGKGKSSKPPGTVCPFFQKNGACWKGANCDMVHSLPATSSQGGGPPDGWKAPSGGYQYKSVVKVLDRKVETMLDGCAGANHVTEELVAGMLNRAADLGIGPEHRRFEKRAYPEYVHGIAAGSPVPLKGAVVRLLEGTDPENARDGPEVLVRCKVAARGTSDWHGLILGDRALDHPSRLGLGFRPGPDCHVLDTLGIKMPRCEDLSRTRKDKAYPFTSVISSVDDELCCEPGDEKRQLLLYDGEDILAVEAGEGVLVPVKRETKPFLDGSLCERVLPIALEAVPGIWPSSELNGMVLVTSLDSDAVLQPGDPVAEVRAGLVETSLCECGLMDMTLVVAKNDKVCELCGTAQLEAFDPGVECGSRVRHAVRDLQGCTACQRSVGGRGRKSGYGLLAALVAVSTMSQCTGAGAYASGRLDFPRIENPGVNVFPDSVPGPGWWDFQAERSLMGGWFLL
eukprot:s114_g5.t1